MHTLRLVIRTKFILLIWLQIYQLGTMFWFLPLSLNPLHILFSIFFTSLSLSLSLSLQLGIPDWEQFCLHSKYIRRWSWLILSNSIKINKNHGISLKFSILNKESLMIWKFMINWNWNSGIPVDIPVVQEPLYRACDRFNLIQSANIILVH